jgi:RNA polymerase sigma-32 factor
MISSRILDDLMRDASRYPYLSRDDEADLIRQYRGGGPGAARAKERLICSLLRACLREAHRYGYTRADLEDMMQVGIFGLIRAVERFDTTRGASLMTYARAAMRRRMRLHLLRTLRIVRCESTAFRAAFDAPRPGDSRYCEQAVLDRSHVTVEQLRAARLRLTTPDVSMDAPYDSGATRHDLMADPGPSPEDLAAEKEQVELARQIVIEAARTVGQNRAAFRRALTDAPLTDQQMGDAYGVSRQRADQWWQGLVTNAKTVARRRLRADRGAE